MMTATKSHSKEIAIRIRPNEDKDGPPIVSLDGPGYEALLKKTTKEELTDTDKVALDVIRYLYSNQDGDLPSGEDKE